MASSNAAASAQQQQYYLGANLKDPHQLVLMSPIKEISNVVGAGGPSPPPSPSMGSRCTYHHIYSLVLVIISKLQIFVSLNLNLRPSHVVFHKIGILRFFGDFMQKMGFQAKYMDFRRPGAPEIPIKAP